MGFEPWCFLRDGGLIMFGQGNLKQIEMQPGVTLPVSSSTNDIPKRGSRCKSIDSLALWVALLILGFAAPTLAQTVTPASASLSFTAAQVGIAHGTAETLTATFQITGYSSVLTPTATMHYGLAYSVGAVSCTGSVGSQSCSVPVTFYPGGRRDALFLKNGNTRLATVLVYGVGESPFALLQPGMFSTSTPQPGYLYDSVVDENGVL